MSAGTTAGASSGTASPLEAVLGAKRAVVRLGGAFMTDPATREAGKALGLSGWAFYHGGRSGVLGGVDASVVVAAEVFFPPDRVAQAWEKVRPVRPHGEVAQVYAAQCHRWGREHLTDFAGTQRLAELAGRVAAAAEVAGLPLFAGWRALALPDDPPARLAQLLHLLREHRGGLHGVAVLASGLTPLEAILASDHGSEGAAWFGWEGPFPDGGPLRARRAEAEELTDRLVAPAYAALGLQERQELVTLLADADGLVRRGGARP